MTDEPKSKGKAVISYVRNHMRSYTFRCNLNYDRDIITLLDQQPNVSGYVKALLRDEAERRGFGELKVENKKKPINPAVGKFNPEYYPGRENG